MARKQKNIDVGRIATTAVETLLHDGQAQANSQVGHDEDRGHSRLGTAGAIAVGVVLAAAARAAYTRARSLDLTQVAGAVEQRLTSSNGE
ncbi:MAG TPA: hypothetical protein VK919_02075 [Solirubrobacterales bacterium]|nr:hypothetical protein [Solirubrobacterales bacterium]